MDEVAKAFRRGAFTGGVLSIAIGVMLLVWPDKTLLVVAALIGIFLVLLGIARLVEAFSARALPGAARALRGLAGVLLVILGIAILRHLENSLTVLTVLLGIAWMVGGLAEIAFGLLSREPGGVTSREAGGGRGGEPVIASSRSEPVIASSGSEPGIERVGRRSGSRAGSLLLGVLDVLAGLVLFLWPKTSLTVVVWVVGIWLIAIGVIQLALALMKSHRRPG